MRRKLLGLALLAAVVLSSGCSYFHFWANDFVNHGKVMYRDFQDMHRTIDRHFFNYDWNDPTL